MALFHLKQSRMNQMSFSENPSIKQEYSNNNCFNLEAIETTKSQTLMLGGVNLGDVMKQTVLEELNLIKQENQQRLQKMKGC